MATRNERTITRTMQTVREVRLEIPLVSARRGGKYDAPRARQVVGSMGGGTLWTWRRRPESLGARDDRVSTELRGVVTRNQLGGRDALALRRESGGRRQPADERGHVPA